MLKCVGIGKCRKTDTGTMCPSYMATRDEMHSTRGRARILFEAMSGDTLKTFTDQLGEQGARPRACRAKVANECPASVDMAAYKAEFLAHYYEEHGRPRSSKIFGNIHEPARRASRTPRLANALMNAPLFSRLGKRLYDIHPQRSFPKLASRTFRSWFDRHQGSTDQTQREVVLFPDTFTNYFEPEVAIAATEVLERANFRVVIPRDDLCCGRPLYDQGMLDRAKKRLQESMDSLWLMVERGAYVVGLEPSCILTFRDELPSLFPDNARAKILSERALLLDEFLKREVSGYLPPQPKPLKGKALLRHGHRHQKALAGLDSEVFHPLEHPRTSSSKSSMPDAAEWPGRPGHEDSHFAVSKALRRSDTDPRDQCQRQGYAQDLDGFSCCLQTPPVLLPIAIRLHFAQVLNLAAQR